MKRYLFLIVIISLAVGCAHQQQLFKVKSATVANEDKTYEFSKGIYITENEAGEIKEIKVDGADRVEYSVKVKEREYQGSFRDLDNENTKRISSLEMFLPIRPTLVIKAFKGDEVIIQQEIPLVLRVRAFNGDRDAHPGGDDRIDKADDNREINVRPKGYGNTEMNLRPY